MRAILMALYTRVGGVKRIVTHTSRLRMDGTHAAMRKPRTRERRFGHPRHSLIRKTGVIRKPLNIAGCLSPFADIRIRIMLGRLAHTSGRHAELADPEWREGFEEFIAKTCKIRNRVSRCCTRTSPSVIMRHTSV
jgi:hypothetical protein